MTSRGELSAIQELRPLTSRQFLTAGTVYGLIFALTFSAATWGYDAILLANSQGSSPWLKLLVAAPIVLAICLIAGRFAAHFRSTGLYVAIWSLAGGLLGQTAGWVPFDGQNLAIWLTDARFWGLAVYPQGPSEATRTALIVIIGVVVGAIAGILERILAELSVEWSDRPQGLGTRSYLILSLCVPLALVLAGAAHEFMYSPLRSAQLHVHSALELALDERRPESAAINYGVFNFYRDSLSEDYRLHLVEFDLSAESSAVVDVKFEDDFILRCTMIASSITFCDDFLPVANGWLAQLARARGEGIEAPLDSSGYTLQVEPGVSHWLEQQSPVEVDRLELHHVAQHGGWVYLQAKEGSDLVMTCRFHGIRPVTVDRCTDAALP